MAKAGGRGGRRGRGTASAQRSALRGAPRRRSPRPGRTRAPPRRSRTWSRPPSGRPCRRSATAAGDAHGRHLDPLAIERAPGWTQAVSRAIVEYLRASVATAWQRGWQPAELARHFGRELSADHAAMVADMITAEMLGYAAATVDARWAAQAAALEAAAPGQGRLVGERRGLPPGLVRARPRRRVHRHRRHRGRDAARVPASARPGEAAPAARHRPAGRAPTAAAAERRRPPARRPPTSGC